MVHAENGDLIHEVYISRHVFPNQNYEAGWQALVSQCVECSILYFSAPKKW
jgi:hypothetical protein